MFRPSAGHARFAFRVPQSEQLPVTDATSSLRPPASSLRLPRLSLGCCNWDPRPYNYAQFRPFFRGMPFALPCGGGGSMDDPVLREQSPAEYFKDLIDSALARQHLHTSELTAYYLVDLLCRF